MARGGYRPGGGRPKGAKNKRTLELQRRMEEAEAILQEKLENCSDLDAHGVLMAIYKDMDQPVNLRMEAAKAAAPFEKPRLQAQHVTGDMGGKTHEEWLKELDEKRRPAIYIPDNGRDSDQPHIIAGKERAFLRECDPVHGDNEETIDSRIATFPKVRGI